MKFQLNVADGTTGAERTIMIECDSPEEATKHANSAGYLVSAVAVAPSKTPSRRKRIYFVGGLVVIATAGVAVIILTTVRHSKGSGHSEGRLPLADSKVLLSQRPADQSTNHETANGAPQTKPTTPPETESFTLNSSA